MTAIPLLLLSLNRLINKFKFDKENVAFYIGVLGIRNTSSNIKRIGSYLKKYYNVIDTYNQNKNWYEKSDVIKQLQKNQFYLDTTGQWITLALNPVHNTKKAVYKMSCQIGNIDKGTVIIGLSNAEFSNKQSYYYLKPNTQCLWVSNRRNEVIQLYTDDVGVTHQITKKCGLNPFNTIVTLTIEYDIYDHTIRYIINNDAAYTIEYKLYTYPSYPFLMYSSDEKITIVVT